MKVSFYVISVYDDNDRITFYGDITWVRHVEFAKKFKTFTKADAFRKKLVMLGNAAIYKVTYHVTKQDDTGFWKNATDLNSCLGACDSTQDMLEDVIIESCDSCDGELFKVGNHENIFICDVQFPTDMMHVDKAVNAVADYMEKHCGNRPVVEIHNFDSNTYLMYSGVESFVLRKKNIEN